MTLLRFFNESPVVQALGWTLFHLLWEGSVVALALAIVLYCARSATVRYAAAGVALLLMLAGFAVTFVRLNGSERTARLTTPVRPIRLHGAQVPDFAADLAVAESMDFAPWAASLWMAGVAIFYLRAAGGWISMRRWRTIGVCALNDCTMARFDELVSRMRVSKPVILLQSSLADVPLTMGYLRPVILLPVGLLTGMPARQIEYILLHELAHIRRHDYLINLLQTLTEGFLFYHPAVWWISGVIRAERENCCDDLAAGQGDPREYAATLAALEEYRQSGKEPALAATGGNLMKRIRRLLTQPERPRAALTPLFSASLIVVLSVGLAMAYQAQQTRVSRVDGTAVASQSRAVTPVLPLLLPAQANAQAVPQATADPESPWQKWLTQDVAYIVTDEERAAFQSLSSDEEREHFIEQFWLRRDPTPGTDANEFKQEHYRRIGFVNQHFAGPRVAGWKTDRGRIYITFGPPDEIDSHPSGGTYVRPAGQGGGEATVSPFEQWRYKWIQGIGQDVAIEFVDVARTGDFRMTMDPHEKETGGPVPKPGQRYVK